MKVLSLFDGISCGRVALERASIPVEAYHAFEIDPYAIQVSRQNLDGKSKLFFDYVRAKEEMRPQWFLFENVASMNAESKAIISELLGCEPVFIDSANFSAQTRPRLYWTNIPLDLSSLPTSDLCLADVLEDKVDEKYFYNLNIINVDMSKPVCGLLEPWNYEMMKRIYNPRFKSPTLTCVTGGNQQKKVMIDGRARKLTPLEYERLQTLPDNYTRGVSDSQCYKAIGNGWTVDVITWILSQIPREAPLENWML